MYSLRQIMAVLLCLFILLTILLLGISSPLYIDSVKQSEKWANDVVTAEQNDQFEQSLFAIKDALYSFANKEEITDYLCGSPAYRARNIQNIRSMLNDIPRYIPSVCDVIFAASDGHSVMSDSDMDIHNFMLRYQLVNEYGQVGSSNVYCVTNIPQKYSDYILSMVVPIRKNDAHGILVACCTVDTLMEKLSGTTYALYHDGVQISANAEGAPTPEALKIDQASGKDSEWVGYKISLADWELLIKTPLDTLSTQFETNLRHWNVIILPIVLCIECVLVFAIYKMIVTPINQISRQSTEILSSTEQIHNPAFGCRELTYLVDNINTMVSRTNQLTEEVNTAKLQMMTMNIQKLQAQNMFLQAQINPHFLYNMLECICGMASENGEIEIREMTYSLSKLYRYCLKSPQSTLGEELESITLYENIVRQRYREEYSIQINVPEELQILPMPRMILEPLVENAIQHGFVRGQTAAYFIRISAESNGNWLLLSIADNGCGMEPEQMEELNRRIQEDKNGDLISETSIGIRNVAHRLRLMYGENSRFCMKPNDGGGLKIEINISYSEP